MCLSVCLSVCLCLNHALTVKHRDTIFGMDTHVTPRSKIGYVILTSEVIWGHQRSKTVIWGHWGQILKTTLRDAIFFMHTHMTPRNNVGYVNLTSEVNWGHQRSNLGQTCRIIVKSCRLVAIYPTYVCFDSEFYRELKLKIIWGQIRSSKVIRGQTWVNFVWKSQIAKHLVNS